jgi:hypothetical protein
MIKPYIFPWKSALSWCLRKSKDWCRLLNLLRASDKAASHSYVAQSRPDTFGLLQIMHGSRSKSRWETTTIGCFQDSHARNVKQVTFCHPSTVKQATLGKL